jgi:hypothetical protein
MTALEVSPLIGLPDEARIRTSLIERGQIYGKLRGHHFLAFTDKREERQNERVVIDARVYHKYEEGQFPEYAKFEEIEGLTWEQSMNRHSSSLPSASTSFEEIDTSPLNDEQRLLAQPTARCFNIEQKKWQNLDITKLHEIPWAERPSTASFLLKTRRICCWLWLTVIILRRQSLSRTSLKARAKE